MGIPLAAGALLPGFGLSLTPSAAGAMMGFSSLAVMGNSLSLRLQSSKLARRKRGSAAAAAAQAAAKLEEGQRRGGV